MFASNSGGYKHDHHGRRTRVPELVPVDIGVKTHRARFSRHLAAQPHRRGYAHHPLRGSTPIY